MKYVNIVQKITFEESTRVNVAITIFTVKAQMNVYIERNFSCRNFCQKIKQPLIKTKPGKTWKRQMFVKFFQIYFLGTE